MLNEYVLIIIIGYGSLEWIKNLSHRILEECQSTIIIATTTFIIVTIIIIHKIKHNYA